MSELDHSPCREEVLRAAIERLTAERDQWKSDCELRSQTAADRLVDLERLSAERDQLLGILREIDTDKIDHMRAEIERLRAALQPFARLKDGERAPWDAVMEARRVLEGMK